MNVNSDTPSELSVIDRRVIQQLVQNKRYKCQHVRGLRVLFCRTSEVFLKSLILDIFESRSQERHGRRIVSHNHS